MISITVFHVLQHQFSSLNLTKILRKILVNWMESPQTNEKMKIVIKDEENEIKIPCECAL